MVRMLFIVFAFLTAPVSLAAAQDASPAWINIVDADEEAAVPNIAEATFDGPATILDARPLLEERHLRPVTYREMLRYVSVAGPTLDGARVVALGSFIQVRGVVMVLTIHVQGNVGRAVLERADTRWPAGTVFLAVSMDPKSPEIAERGRESGPFSHS